jgi:hypothetical protein
MICDIFTYVSFTSLFFCLESTALFLPHTTPGHPRHAACIFPVFFWQKTGRDNDGECRVTGNRGGDRLSIYVCMDGKMAAFIRTELLTLPNDFLRNCAYGGTARVVSLFLKRVNGEPG